MFGTLEYSKDNTPSNGNYRPQTQDAVTSEEGSVAEA